MSDFSERLKQAMELKDVSPIELSKRTGIALSSLSEYMAGKFRAKQDKVLLMSEVLNVDPAWLIGADVPMEGIKERIDRIAADPNPFNPVMAFITDLVKAKGLKSLDQISPEMMVKINQLSIECTLKAISAAISENNKE